MCPTSEPAGSLRERDAHQKSGPTIDASRTHTRGDIRTRTDIRTGTGTGTRAGTRIRIRALILIRAPAGIHT